MRYACYAFKSLDPAEQPFIVCDGAWRDEVIVAVWKKTAELAALGYRYSYVRPI